MSSLCPAAFALALVGQLAAPSASSAAPAAAPGARSHDGFYLRMGLGAGGLDMEREGRVSAGTSTWYGGRSRIAGGAVATELSLGGTLAPGLVLAGTILSHEHTNAIVEQDGQDYDLRGPLRSGFLGASLVYYPEPAGGWHFGGTLALGLAGARIPDPGFSEFLGGGGGAAALTAGYDFWIADQWSIGLALRVLGARLHGEQTVLGVTGSEDDTFTALALMLSATYH